MQEFSRRNEESDQSVSVTFEQTAIQPPLTSVVSCALFTGRDGHYVMARHPGGWDLPSSVRKDDEETEACVYRIAESIGINITEPQLIGQWVMTKNFDSPLNQALPLTSYQLLYVADLTHEGAFTASDAFIERQLVAKSEVPSLHRNPDNFRDIFEYARARFNRIP
jgi:hypothetical protein